MAHKIREYVGAIYGEPPLTDVVEIDETYVGGRTKGRKKDGITGSSTKGGKSIVFGILERDGEIFTKVVPTAGRKDLIPEILRHVPKGPRIMSDEWYPYKILTALGYRHEMIEHGRKEYARGDVNVNTFESFWSMLKRSIRGTHIHVSRKHLQKYLGEFEYRHNLRKKPDQMFVRLLASL